MKYFLITWLDNNNFPQAKRFNNETEAKQFFCFIKSHSIYSNFKIYEVENDVPFPIQVSCDNYNIDSKRFLELIGINISNS